jgi:hypothetical protein
VLLDCEMGCDVGGRADIINLATAFEGWRWWLTLVGLIALHASTGLPRPDRSAVIQGLRPLERQRVFAFLSPTRLTASVHGLGSHSPLVSLSLADCGPLNGTGIAR